MNKYDNAICPVCKAKIFPEDLVVCPDCGAPHHRICYNNNGACFYNDKHGTDEQWDKINPPQSKTYETTKKCPNCGSPLENGAVVCNNCHRPQTSTEPEFNTAQAQNQQQQNENNTANNPFFIRNGLNANEKIDGHAIGDIARLVGYNALRYIRIFKRMADLKRKISWNWIAFLFPDLWLISRKCYGPGILMGFFRVLISVLINVSGGSVLQYNAFSGSVNISALTDKSMIAIDVVCIVTIIVYILIGMFGDYIYKKRVFRTLDALKQQGATDDMTMIRVGGVNLFLPIALYLVANILVMLILSII